MFSGCQVPFTRIRAAMERCGTGTCCTLQTQRVSFGHSLSLARLRAIALTASIYLTVPTTYVTLEPVEDLNTAIEALQRARETKLAELQAIDRALEALGAAAAGSQATQDSQNFADLGITVAAKRYLKEVGTPRTTREIADALQERGVKTRSKNYIATVYATLHNSSAFERTNEGTWELAGSIT